MKARILSAPVPAGLFSAFLLAVPALLGALLGGCDNPVDEPGEERPTTATVPLAYRNSNLLRLDFSRLSGRTSLKVSNTGLVALDSAAILVNRQNEADYSSNQYSPFFPLPEFECLVKVGPLAPGSTQDLGVIDSLNSGGLQHGSMQAWVLRVSLDGRPQGNPFAGYYTGTFNARKRAGRESEGVANGLIDAEGKFRFGLFVPEFGVPDKMVTGSVREDGTFARFTWTHPNLVGLDGRLDAGDKEYLGTFTMGMGADSGWVDSVEIRLESRLPRK